MTTTETEQENESFTELAAPSMLERLATGTDHLFLGRMWTTAAGFFLLITLVIGVLVGIERVDLGGTVLFGSGDEYFQFWTLYRVGLVLLGVVPMFVGLATAVVPLQVGSPSIVFSRAAALSFWTWLLGSSITLVGFLADGGLGAPNAGSQRQAVALTIVGLLLVIVGILLAITCVVTTVVAARVSGLSIREVPYFSWSMLVAGTLWLVTLPVLAANAVLAYVDLRGRSAVYFGKENVIWDQLDWVFTHPQIYVFALPLIGIAFDVVPVVAKSRQRNHDVVLTAIGLLGVVGFGAYAQPFFDTPGTPVMQEALYVVSAFIAIPIVLLLLGGLVDTLKRGVSHLSAKPPAPVILVLISVLLLLVGTLMGAIRSIAPLDLLVRSFTGAQMTFTIGAALVAVIAGSLWWGDRIIGKSAPQGLGLLSGLAITGGVLLIGGFDMISGFFKMNDFPGSNEIEAGSPNSVVEVFNVITVIGALILLGGLMLWMLVAWRRLNGSIATTNPWGGHTLEWSAVTSSESSSLPDDNEVRKGS